MMNLRVFPIKNNTAVILSLEPEIVINLLLKFIKFSFLIKKFVQSHNAQLQLIKGTNKYTSYNIL
jgi:hypothetical protein